MFLEIPLLFIRAFKTIVSNKKLLTLCVIPWLLAVVFFVVIFVSSFALHAELVGWIFGSSDAWYAFVFDIVVLLLELLVSAVAALILTFVVADFLIESFVLKAFEVQGVSLTETGRRSTVVQGFLSSLRDTGLRLIYVGIITILIFIFSWFPPLLLVVLFLSFFLAGLDSFDLPLQLKGLSFFERLRFNNKNFVRNMAVGACYTGLLLIPVFGIFGIYLAYFVAVELVVRDLPESKTI